jgi:hypothetical protein
MMEFSHAKRRISLFSGIKKQKTRREGDGSRAF